MKLMFFPAPLHLKFPKMNEYVKHFDSGDKCINLIIDNKIIQCIMINILELR